MTIPCHTPMVTLSVGLFRFGWNLRKVAQAMASCTRPSCQRKAEGRFQDQADHLYCYYYFYYHFYYYYTIIIIIIIIITIIITVIIIITINIMSTTKTNEAEFKVNTLQLAPHRPAGR
jgi:amino acid transporter